MIRYSLALSALLIAACAAPAPVSAPVSETAAEAPSRIDPAGLATLEGRMRAFVDDGEVAGIHTRMIVGGETVSDMKHGLMSIKDEKPLTDETIYRIYSMTKPVTGVAMMILWEEGAFSLDDPVTKYVPEFEDLRVLTGLDEQGGAITVPVNRPPTIREVMSHTAGFAYGLGGEDPANRAFREEAILRSPDLETFIAKTAAVPLLFQPGEDWSYSAAVDVQGYIVEKISGQTFGDFLDDRIFTPLGMEDTGFFVPESDMDRFSEVYVKDSDTDALVPAPPLWRDFSEDALGMESGGGGLVSTMDDYERFTRMLRSGGALDGARILKPETVELMRVNVMPEGANMFSTGSGPNPQTVGHGFGLDFGVVMDPDASGSPIGKGSYYWGGAAGTWFWIDPENDLIFIGMIQRMDAWGVVDFRGESVGLVYSALDE